MLRQRLLLVGLLFSTLFTAITEGIGISMLVPLLVTVNSSVNTFKSVPVLGDVADLFLKVPLVPRLELIAIALCVVALVRGLMSYLTVVCAELLALRTDHSLRQRAVKRVLELSYEDAHTIGSTTLINYVMGYGVHAGQAGFMQALILTNCVMLVLYLAICLLMSWQLTLFAGVMLIAAVQFVKVPLAHRVRALSALRDNLSIELWWQTLAGIRGLKLLRLFRGEVEEERRIDSALSKFVNTEQRGIYLKSLVDPMFQVAITAIVAILLLASTFLYGEQVVEKIPGIILFLFVLSRMASPVQTINRARISFATNMNCTQLLLDFLAPDSNRSEQNGVREIAHFRNGLSFDHVTFRYRNSDEPVLDDVTFDVPVGGMTAMVGPSGAGKSTIINLIGGLYRAQQGRILVDDVDLAEADLASWRSRVAFVTQDTFIFDDTVARNLRVAAPTATSKQMIEAAQKAHAHDFIMALPQGYDTPIGERGIALSGGQMQRLALARALLADADLLVLDEATSNLDAETEATIKDMLTRFAEQKTIFVVAHRLATVLRADKIVVLDCGRIVETGTHQSLMAANGLYCRMVTLQMLVDESAGASDRISQIDADYGKQKVNASI